MLVQRGERARSPQTWYIYREVAAFVLVMSRLVEASKEVESPVHSRNWRTSFFLAVLDTIQIYLLFLYCLSRYSVCYCLFQDLM